MHYKNVQIVPLHVPIQSFAMFLMMRVGWQKRNTKMYTKLHSIILYIRGKIIWWTILQRFNYVFYFWCYHQPLNKGRIFCLIKAKCLKKSVTRRNTFFISALIMNFKQEVANGRFFFVFRVENDFLRVSDTFR